MKYFVSIFIIIILSVPLIAYSSEWKLYSLEGTNYSFCDIDSIKKNNYKGYNIWIKVIDNSNIMSKYDEVSNKQEFISIRDSIADDSYDFYFFNNDELKDEVKNDIIISNIIVNNYYLDDLATSYGTIDCENDNLVIKYIKVRNDNGEYDEAQNLWEKIYISPDSWLSFLKIGICK